jgi:hypothetical protein
MTLKDLPLSKQEKKKKELDFLKEKFGTVAGELDTKKPNSKNAHFDITFQDRQRLRKIVKKIHFKNYPKYLITDKEADKLIEALGPKVAEDLIKKYIEQIK